MNNRGILFGLLGVGALFFVLAPPTSTAPADGDAQGRDTARKAPAALPLGPKDAGRGFRLIQQYLGVPLEGIPVADRPSVDVLIATVADPFDSHLDWSYDATQEAIRRAFESSGFVLDRFWIADPKAVIVDSQTGDTVAARTQYPGVLLFRRNDSLGKTALHLLYLIGETPTAGIHKQAFLAALRERDMLLRLAAPSGAGPALKIVGPTFSGSATSLRRLLDQWWERPSAKETRSIRVISGSATSVNVGAVEGRGRPAGGAPVSFRATVQSDSSFLVALDSVVEMLKIEPWQVAVLSEGSTEYGRKIGESADTSGGFLTIPFPMNISSLREEYERHPDQSEGQHLALGQAPAVRAPLSLQEDHHTTESPPATSRLSVPAIEQLISQIVRSLDQHGIRMVALLATDVRDKLFLAGEIKKRLRSVQLVTSESNVLYLRPDRYRSLHGMLVLSTYPLILENQRWSRADSTGGGRLMPFANEGAEGTYNAVLLQLGTTGRLVDYQSPGIPGLGRPPVWLTAVGSASFVPLIFLPGLTDTGYVHNGADRQATLQAGPGGGEPTYRPMQMSYGQKGVVVVLALLVLSLAVDRLLILRGIRKHPRGIGGWPKDTPAVGVPQCEEYDTTRARVECSSLEVHETFYAAVQMVGLLGVFLPAASVYVALSGSDRAQTAAVLLLLLVTAVAGTAFLASAWSTITHLHSTRGEDIRLLKESLSPKPERWSWILEVVSRYGVAFLTLVYLILVLSVSATILRMGAAQTPQSWLFFVRATQIDGELSPLPPLLLSALGFAWWATWHLARVQLLRRQTPFELLFTPPHSAPVEELKGLQKTVRDTRQRLFMMVPGVSGVLIGVWLVLVIMSLVSLFSRTIERWLLQVWTFDVLLTAGVLGILIAIPWGVCRLFVTWRSLRQHLEELRCLPLVTAFDRLPPRIARLTGFSVVTGSAHHVIGAVTDLQWRELRNIAKHRLEGKPDPDKRMGDHELLSRIRSCMTEAESKQEAAPIVAHEHRLREIYPVLRQAWDAEPELEEIQVVERVVSDPDPSANPDLASTASKIRRSFASPARVWVRCAEEYFAVQSVEYIEGVFQHLRRLGLFLLVSLLLSTALLSSYPFYPKDRIELVFLALMVCAVTIVIVMMVQMNKDEVLSRISKSDPGRLNWDTTFVLNLVLFGVLPLLSLLATEFPGIRNFLIGWLEPMARAMGKIT